jgi:virginiamycin B lyase
MMTAACALMSASLLAACSASEEEAPAPEAETPAESGPAESGPAESGPAEETRPADGVEPDGSGEFERAAIDIQEWNVPWEGRPRDPYTLDGETVWFNGQANSYIARLDVATGEMERVDLSEGAHPHNLILAEDGDVWYAGNRDSHIGRYDVETGEFERVNTPEDRAFDPHTLIWDSNGDIWFTSQRANSVGRMTLADRAVVALPVTTPNARPYGIKIAPDGTIWFTLFGTNALASLDVNSMAVTEHRLPREEARARRLEITSDGRIWYGDYAGGYLGVFDPAVGEVTGEWPMPNGENSRPYGMASDNQDRIWLVETGIDPNYFVGFDTEAEEFFSITAVPSGGGVIRHMQYLESTGEVWFGADMGTVGRAQVHD